MLLVLLPALLVLAVPKEGIDVLGAPKPGALTGGEPNGDLLSPNVLLALPEANGRFGVPKVFVAGVVPNAPADGVAFAPNMGTVDVLLSAEPNKLVEALKAGALCALVTVAELGAPNTVGVSFAVSNPGAMILVDVFPVMPNVGAVVVCVFEPNNDVVVPNMAPVALVPKDAEGFVCPKIDGEPLPNIEDDVVVEVDVTLALENRPGLTVLFDVDMTLVVDAKIEGAVVFGINTPVVPGTDDVAAKSD